MQLQSSEEIIARSIAQAFPAANLEIEENGAQVAYEISLNGKKLVRLDHIAPHLFQSCITQQAMKRYLRPSQPEPSE